jgi:biotin carboxylase
VATPLNRRRHIAFVEASVTGAGAGALRACRRMDLASVLLVRRPEQYRPCLLRLADIVVECDTRRSEAIADAVRGNPRIAGSLDAVATTADLFVPQAAEVAASLGLPGPSPASAWAARMKSRTRAALERHAPALNPMHRIVANEAEAIAAAAALGFPLIVKPPDLNDGEGVRLVADEAALSEYAATYFLTRRGDGNPPSLLLIEEYCVGPEYSIETISPLGGPMRLLGVTAKFLTGLDDNRFIEIGHAFPVTEMAHLSEVASDALEAIGFSCGTTHIECRMTATGPKVMEINPRLAGGKIGSHLIEYATGVAAPELIVRIALGETAEWRPLRNGAAALRNLWTRDAGRFDGIRNREAVARLPGVAEVIELCPRGAQVKPPTTNQDMIATVIATGRDWREANDSALAAAALADLAVSATTLTPSPAPGRSRR